MASHGPPPPPPPPSHFFYGFSPVGAMSGPTQNAASGGVGSATVMMNGQIPIFDSFSDVPLTLEEPEDTEMLDDDDGRMPAAANATTGGETGTAPSPSSMRGPRRSRGSLVSEGSAAGGLFNMALMKMESSSSAATPTSSDRDGPQQRERAAREPKERERGDKERGTSLGAVAVAWAELSKRSNFSAKLVEELRDMIHILDTNLRLKYAAPGLVALAGYGPKSRSALVAGTMAPAPATPVNTITVAGAENLLGRFLTDMVHPDDVGLLTSELHECIATGAPLRVFYRFLRRDGTYVILETTGHAHIAQAKFAPSPTNKSAFCQAVFLTSRPYGGENTFLLDSFLEHKVENERLRRRIAELQKEEDDYNEDANHRWISNQEGRSDVTPSEDASTVVNAATAAGGVLGSMTGSATTATVSGVVGAPPPPSAAQSANAAAASSAMPPPSIPQAKGNNAALTRENLEGAVARSKPDSIRDKMRRYEAGVGTTPGAGAGAGDRVDATGAGGGGAGADGGGGEGDAAGGAAGAGGATSSSAAGRVSLHTDTIEMLTGLRYLEGERSRGITTGNRSPTLVTGDVGIAIPIDRDPRAGLQKKKQKVVEEYVCTDCGTLESPEWRRGPHGPKTLCNACGLRFAKLERKNRRKMEGAPAAAAAAAAAAGLAQGQTTSSSLAESPTFSAFDHPDA